MVHQKIFILTAIFLLALTACQGDESVVSEPQTSDLDTAVKATAPEATAVPAPTAVPTTPPEPTAEQVEPPPEPTIVPPTLAPETAVTPPIIEDVTIEAADGLPLHATFFAPGGMAPFPGVLLLHMLGSDRQVWVDNGFAEKLVADGYAVLALDMRGHGDSVGPIDWAKADEDLQRVWAYFAGRDEVDGERTAVIGASIGSNMALRTGANETAVKTVALLSPGLDYRGVTTEDALVQYGDRPILIVASEEDAYAADSSRTLSEQAAGETHLEMYNGAGHGTNMFGPQPDLADLLLEWLNQYLPET